MRIVALQQERRDQHSQDVVVVFNLRGQQLIEDSKRKEGDEGMASYEERDGRHFPEQTAPWNPSQMGWD